LPPAECVVLTGRLADVRTAVGRSRVVVVPLRHGSGTRLKVLQAMAVGTPVVSTTKGIEGLGLAGGIDVLVADEPAAFAAHVVRATVGEWSRRGCEPRLGTFGRCAERTAGALAAPAPRLTCGSCC
jgi:glycosyltransferase involved in cell wall biosynthesis